MDKNHNPDAAMDSVLRMTILMNNTRGKAAQTYVEKLRLMNTILVVVHKSDFIRTLSTNFRLTKYIKYK